MSRWPLGPRLTRFVSYVVGISLFAVVAVRVAMATDTCDSSQVECDLSGIGYAIAGGAAILVGLVVVVVIELTVLSRARRKL